MPRLSIELDQRQHQQLKAMAALKGQSIKDYVLSRALVDLPDAETMTDKEALGALKQLLAPRVAEAEAGEAVGVTLSDVKSRAKARRRA